MQARMRWWLIGILALVVVALVGVLEPLKWVLIVYRIVKGPYRGILYSRVGRGQGKPREGATDEQP